MARILIADNTPGATRLATLFRSAHSLLIVDSCQRAIAATADDGFDLIIVGVHFDDSQMFDLISALKKNPLLETVPVMGFSEDHTRLSVINRNTVETASHLAGACDYIDTSNMSDQEILDRINICLQDKKGIGRAVKSSDETPEHKRKDQESKRNR